MFIKNMFNAVLQFVLKSCTCISVWASGTRGFVDRLERWHTFTVSDRGPQWQSTGLILSLCVMLLVCYKDNCLLLLVPYNGIICKQEHATVSYNCLL